MYEKVKLVNN